MQQIRETLKGRKTYIIAFIMVLASLVEVLTGDISIVEFVGTENFQLFLEGLGISAIRAGISKIDKD